MRRALIGIIPLLATLNITAPPKASTPGPVLQAVGEVTVAVGHHGDHHPRAMMLQAPPQHTFATLRIVPGLDIGVVGAYTSSAPATPTKPAVRLDPPTPPPTDVESIIRYVWPDDLENHALRIAYRESRLQPEVINANRNATGLFQIMWTVHRSWLCPQLNICAQSDLQDAMTNTVAAYALYQRAGGWGPWRL